MSSDSDNRDLPQQHRSGLASMQRLMRGEIARLKEELEAIKAGEHPQRRSLIKDHVERIDERQSALDSLDLSATEAEPPH